ncbi:hypothetical protein RvY_18974 [Ramazzottius varieornatus]|uniref:PHD-type domain-containing protein n=1 Tax=Ramazzottius varieornatus TaxID=947166 RepID=A0A1D1WAC2_RAMVA|nr:hypothetical protein RvY_18974 [Ramazzottius varieornatus]
MMTRRSKRITSISKTETLPLTPAPTPAPPTRELSSRRKKLPRYLEEDYVPDSLSERPAKSRKVMPPVEVVEEPTVSKDEHIRPKVDTKVEEEPKATAQDAPRSALQITALPADCCRICLSCEMKERSSARVFCAARPCEYKVHLQCLKDSYAFDFLDKFIPYFKCPSHRICVVCGRKKSLEEEVCVTCETCNRMFHLKCHSPPVAASLNGWKCSGCDPVEIEAANKAKEEEKARKERRAEKKRLRLLKAAEKSRAKEDRQAARMAASARNVLTMAEKGAAKMDQEADKDMKKLRREQRRLAKMSVELDWKEHWGSETEDSVLSDRATSWEEEVEMNPVFVRHLEAKRMALQEESELRHDLCLWTVDQCASYFVDSFPDLADLIRTHELYGSSLMLISSQQFRTLFGLPLGKCLIFYDAICKWRKAKF